MNLSRDGTWSTLCAMAVGLSGSRLYRCLILCFTSSQNWALNEVWVWRSYHRQWPSLWCMTSGWVNLPASDSAAMPEYPQHQIWSPAPFPMACLLKFFVYFVCIFNTLLCILLLSLCFGSACPPLTLLQLRYILSCFIVYFRILSGDLTCAFQSGV